MEQPTANAGGYRKEVGEGEGGGMREGWGEGWREGTLIHLLVRWQTGLAAMEISVENTQS